MTLSPFEVRVMLLAVFQGVESYRVFQTCSQLQPEEIPDAHQSFFVVHFPPSWRQPHRLAVLD